MSIVFHSASSPGASMSLFQGLYQARSPRILRARCTSLGMIVTRFAWIAHRLESSNNATRYASDASWQRKVNTSQDCRGRRSRRHQWRRHQIQVNELFIFDLHAFTWVVTLVGAFCVKVHVINSTCSNMFLIGIESALSLLFNEHLPQICCRSGAISDGAKSNHKKDSRKW